MELPPSMVYEMKKLSSNIRAIAFDADDTLWACQPYFNKVEREYCELLADYGTAAEISASLFETETDNMAELGYGSKAFTLSLVENALKVSRGRVSGATIGRIIELGRMLLRLDATPLDGVTETLQRLSETGRWRMAVFTKGELLDQESKLHRSGLERFFYHVSIVSDKTTKAYRNLCQALEVQPEQLVMVGNSFKSDVVPALSVGCWTVHIPFHTTWLHEQTEEFAHERLWRLERFAQLVDLMD